MSGFKLITLLKNNLFYNRIHPRCLDYNNVEFNVCVLITNYDNPENTEFGEEVLKF